jgi:hypothetical protein
MIRSTFIAVGICLGIAGANKTAHAKDPWEETEVSDETKKAAEALFVEGNDFYKQNAYQNAIEKYRAALKLWNHPSLHLNLANSLVRADKPLEAAEELEAALKYGSSPFQNAGIYDNALLLQASLKGQVGWIELSCDQVGAKVTLDGNPVLNCPGTQKIRTLVKEHAVNAELNDHVPYTRRIFVPGGETTKDKINMVPLKDAVITKYKYPKWIPWTVAGVGGGVALGGLFTYISGRNLMQSFDTRFGETFPRGATEDKLKETDNLNQLYSDRQSAKTRGAVGISLMAVGGSALVGGLFFGLVLNRPYSELPKLDIAPTQGGATATLRGTF